MLAIVPIGQVLFYRLPVNQRKEVISFSQRTMRYFMLFVLNLVFVQGSQIIDFNSSFGDLDTNRT